jgi:hypothetical protein
VVNFFVVYSAQKDIYLVTRADDFDLFAAALGGRSTCRPQALTRGAPRYFRTRARRSLILVSTPPGSASSSPCATCAFAPWGSVGDFRVIKSSFGTMHAVHPWLHMPLLQVCPLSPIAHTANAVFSSTRGPVGGPAECIDTRGPVVRQKAWIGGVSGVVVNFVLIGR